MQTLVRKSYYKADRYIPDRASTTLELSVLQVNKAHCGNMGVTRRCLNRWCRRYICHGVFSIPLSMGWPTRIAINPYFCFYYV